MMKYLFGVSELQEKNEEMFPWYVYADVFSRFISSTTKQFVLNNINPIIHHTEKREKHDVF